MTLAVRSKSDMDRKIISISSKRQVTIPQKYFEILGFDREAECILKDGEIIIRPIRMVNNEFAEEILSDLIGQGYSGNELLEKFKEQGRKIRPAVERMLSDAEKTAKNGTSIPLDELFGSEGE